MDFENRTRSPAWLLRSSGSGTRMYGSLITRTRHQLTEDGALAPPPAELALTDLRRDDVKTPYGVFEPDDFFPRMGTDVIVLGQAVSPEPVTEMIVRVAAGSYRVELLVVGDRVWERGADGALVPGPPAPFTVMPIRYENAFGGVTKNEYGDLPDPNNPVGKGFYLSEADALGHALPNLEDPAQPVRAFSDRPAVVGLGPYPSRWGLRLTKVVTVNPVTGAVTIDPEKGLYDRAHPALSGVRLGDGDTVTLEGVSLHGRVAFSLPRCPFAVEVVLGATTTRLAPVLEEVLVDLDAGLVDLTYRKLFKYEMVPYQQRRTVLLAGPEGQSSPMIGFPHKKSNFGINLDLHSGLFLTPVGMPLPIKLGLHVGAALLAAPFSGMGSNKGNGSNILADGQPVVSRGHEVKYTILPHVNVLPPPPIINVLIPLLILGCSSKTQCAASKVQCTDGPLAISMMRYVGINSACADPCTMPTSMIFNWGTVNVGFTLGDIVAAIVLFVLEAITSYICDKLTGKFSRWKCKTLTNKLAGALLTPLLTYFRKHLAGKLADKIAEETTKAVVKALWGEGPGGKLGDAIADAATKRGADKDATAWATDPFGNGMGKSADWAQQYVDNHAEPVPAGGGA